jgi:hypothetical protein
MRAFLRFSVLILITTLILSACVGIPDDHIGPVISDISTSGKVLVISDCLATSVTVTAKLTDTSRITNVLLWYRVGSDQPYASTKLRYAVFALASAPSGTTFSQFMFPPSTGLFSGAAVETAGADQPVPGAASDHAAPQSPITHR